MGDSIIKDLAQLAGATDTTNGSWLVSFANELGVTSPVNGSWWEAIGLDLGLTAVNGSWIQAIAIHYGATDPMNGSWLQALYDNISFGPTFDPDAQAFITAASITDPTQQTAVDNLFLGLKSDGIYSKFEALYLPLWGDASKNKWNIVNPVDSDAAHRLTFNGGFTHSVGGIVPNASNAYANTHLKDSDLSNVNYHFSIWTPTNTSGFYDVGCQISNSSKRTLLIANNGGTSFFAGYTNGFGSALSAASGHLLVNYDDGSIGGSTAYLFYRNGTNVGGSLQTSLAAANLDFYLCALNENGSVQAGSYGNKTIRAASFGERFTPTEVSDFNTRLTTFFTALGL